MTTIVRICATIAMLFPAALLPESGHAATRSVTESAQYTLADNDSRNDARQICASTAKRTALDKAGSLFESDLTANRAEAKGAVADDARLQMRSYVAAVVGSETVGEHFSVSNDRLTVSCTVRITFDPDEIGNRLQKIAGNTELRQNLAAQQAQIDILENQLRTLRAGVVSAPDQAVASPPAIADPALDQSELPPQEAETPPAAFPPQPTQYAQLPSYAAPSYPPPPYAAPSYAYAPAPPPVSWPTQAPVVYRTATAYPPPPAAYYYYRPAPVYAPRVVYGGWYYGSRRRW